MADKPSDIASVRKLQEQLTQFSALRKTMPLIGPVLSLLGSDAAKMTASLDEFSLREKEFVKLTRILDRFNDLFGPRGWIAYDWLNTEVAEASVNTAEAGNMAEAEMILVQHYSADQVRIQLLTLSGLACFRPRMRLAELALADYSEGHYHACVPVVLALLDGMVNDLEQQGFFSQSHDLSAWDSLAACGNGLDQLKALLFKPRKKTTEAPIDLPFRNGILHGMDLGYDNQMVAAKSWAALFAAADWVRRIEQGKKQAPPETPEANWSEVSQLLRENAEAKAKLEAWRPRGAEERGFLGFTSGTPKAALDEFLRAWKDKKYGVMAKRTHSFSQLSINARAGELRDYYKNLILVDFLMEEVVDTTPAGAEIAVKGQGAQDEKPFCSSGRFRLVHLDGGGMPVIHGQPGGTWFINTWNPWQESLAPLVED